MTAYTSPEHHPAFEEYCETIFGLREDGITVIQARIAERLEVSRPAVSEMVRRMDSEGLVSVDEGEIRLTEAGEAIARAVVRRHRLAERFLTDVLGLSWTTAHHEAGKWEHVISPEVEVAMTRLLNDPTTCPHGNPIPGSGYEAPVVVPLSTLGTGSAFTVVRIPEALEFEPGLLEYLEDAALLPGRSGRILSSSPDGTVTVEIDGEQAVGLGSFAADRMLVANV